MSNTPRQYDVSEKRHSPATLAITLALIVIMLFCAWQAIRWTLADLAIRQVREVMIEWQASGTIETLEEWEAMRDLIQKTIRYKPGEPEYHRLYGYLYEWRLQAPLSHDFQALTQEDANTIYLESVEQSLASYRKSLVLRPVWPFSWVRLARVKGNLQQYDDEFIKAMQNIVKYGRNEPQMQLQVNQLALRNFEFIINSPVLFPLVKENTARSLSTTAGLVRRNIDLFNNRYMMAFACNWVDTSQISATARRACEAFTPPE